MRSSIIYLSVSIISGIPFLIGINDPKFYEPQSFAFFPSAISAIGLILVVLITGITGPSSLMALSKAFHEKKDTYHA